jgi:hypothetical protein
MGKRLAKRELFQEIKVEREALNTLLKQIKPRQMTLPGVTPGGWSVKDILGSTESQQRSEQHARHSPLFSCHGALRDWPCSVQIGDNTRGIASAGDLVG